METKVKMYVDSGRYDIIRMDLNRSLKAVKPIEVILRDNGFHVTRETVIDCLNMEKTLSRGAVSDNDAFLLEDGQRQPMFDALELYTNCPHLDGQFEKMKKRLINKDYPKAIQDNEAARLDGWYNDIKRGIYNMLHTVSMLEDINYLYLKRWVSVADGKIMLVENVHDLITEESTVYCESDKALKAYELHKQAADVLKEFIGLFPKDKQPDDIGDLFTVWDGDIAIKNINYNRYL